MMKKFIFALCFNHLVYADGFADLKQIQDRFYEHIYRAGSELGAEHAASVSAPEVAYVAGLLQLPPVTLRGSDEANAIYMSLRKKGESRNVGGSPCDYPPNAQASAAFNASDFSALTRYNKYSETGHSVLGVAAQEKVVLRFAAPPPAAAAPAAAPGIGGLLSGFGGFKNAGIKPPEGGAVEKDPVEAAIALCVRGEVSAVPSAISNNKAAIQKAIYELEKIGASATANQKSILKLLRIRLPKIYEDSDSEDDDDSDDEGSISHHGSVAAYAPASKPASPVAVVNIPSPAPPQGIATAAPAFNPAVAAAPAPAADGAATAPTPTSSSASVAVGGGALPPIDVWAEQEFERRKAEIEHQIEALNSEDVNALRASLRMARRTEINALLKPLEAELARYNNSYAQGSIIAEIKRSYPR
jgi:hypothetical protein